MSFGHVCPPGQVLCDRKLVRSADWEADEYVFCRDAGPLAPDASADVDDFEGVCDVVGQPCRRPPRW
jgi:hypothetical protein